MGITPKGTHLNSDEVWLGLCVSESPGLEMLYCHVWPAQCRARLLHLLMNSHLHSVEFSWPTVTRHL